MSSQWCLGEQRQTQGRGKQGQTQGRHPHPPADVTPRHQVLVELFEAGWSGEVVERGHGCTHACLSESVCVCRGRLEGETKKGSPEVVVGV